MASGAYLNGTDFKARLRRVKEKYPDVVGAGLFQETQVEATECKKRSPVYAGPPGPGKPIPGVLRASIQAIGPFREGRVVYTKIIAGGAAGAYAARQHEETTWFHKIGQAKYIESVIVESAPFMAARVAKRIGLDKIDAAPEPTVAEQNVGGEAAGSAQQGRQLRSLKKQARGFEQISRLAKGGK